MAVSEITRMRLRLSHLEQVPWNKGITGKQSHMYGKRKTLAERRAISVRTTGKFNHFWKGGRSTLVQRLKVTTKYREWRKAIFERDDYRCTNCKRRGNLHLHPDHIKPKALILQERNIRTIEQAIACDELWDTANGRTLCVDCHRATDSYGFKFRKNYLRRFN